MDDHGWNGLKWMEMDGNGWKWMDIVDNGWICLNGMQMAGNR